ncbi:MAG TPA: ABC transporter permease subunit [Ktedonobacteraceae bacterium]
MWFNSVFLKTLRDFRIAILGWSLGMGLVMFEVEATVGSLISTPAARATLVSLASSFAWNAAVVDVDTVGGYATWKIGIFILLIAIWPLLACSRILRGEEERGSMDVLLSLPRGRLRIALEKLAAVWTALLLMGLLIGLITFAGGKSFNADYGLGDALLFGLNLTLICGVFGSLALLVSQFTQERGTAAGVTGGLLVVFIVLDMVHRVIPNTDWISRFSPVYYYNLSKPLVPGYGTNPGAMLVLLGLSVLLSGAGLWLFARRDVGATVALPRFLRLPERAVRPERELPVNAWSLRSVYTRSLAKMALPTFWWTVVIAGFAAWMVVVVKQTADQLNNLATSSSFIKELIIKIGGGATSFNANLLSALFVLVPLMLMAFAVTQASSWAADEEEGRQELVLATPQPRLTVLLARFGALTTMTIIIGVLTLAATVLAAAASGLTLDGGNLTAATLSIIPLGLLIAALGYLFSGWLRSAIDTGLLSFLLVIWFFITFIGPGLSWPDAALRLSVFYYYGTPLLHGLSLANTLGVLAVALVALVLASWRFVYKDIGR